MTALASSDACIVPQDPAARMACQNPIAKNLQGGFEFRVLEHLLKLEAMLLETVVSLP